MGTGPKGCGDRKCGCAGLRGGLAEERQTREGSGTTRRRERWQGKAGARGRGEGTHSVPFPRDRAATVAYCGALCCNSRLVRGHGRTESLSTDNSNRQEWVLTTSCAHACINAKPQKTGPHQQRGRTAAPSICRASSVILEPLIPFSCFQPHLWPA